MAIKLLELPTEPLLRMGKTRRLRPTLEGYVPYDLTSQFSLCIDALSHPVAATGTRGIMNILRYWVEH